jgi:hypothetical protein
MWCFAHTRRQVVIRLRPRIGASVSEAETAAFLWELQEKAVKRIAYRYGQGLVVMGQDAGPGVAERERISKE